MLKGIHHIAIICSDYEQSRDFYTRVLELTVVKETYREERQSYKLDMAVNDTYQIELFSFPDRPPRPTYPEALGLRHLAFCVDDLDGALQRLKEKGVLTEPIRTDKITGKRFSFFSDPDGLPLELYEI